MTEERHRANDRHDTKQKAVKPQREHSQPYASETDDYADDAVKSPSTDKVRDTRQPEVRQVKPRKLEPGEKPPKAPKPDTTSNPDIHG